MHELACLAGAWWFKKIYIYMLTPVHSAMKFWTVRVSPLLTRALCFWILSLDSCLKQLIVMLDYYEECPIDVCMVSHLKWSQYMDSLYINEATKRHPASSMGSTTPLLWCYSAARLQSYVISYFCTSLVYYIIQNVLINKKIENFIFI